MSLNRKEKAKIVAEMNIVLCNHFSSRPDEVKKFVSGISAGEGIHRVPFKFSGWISEDALNAKINNSKYIPTKEHFYSRRQSANLIWEQIESGKSLSRIIKIILSRSRVHYTTADENQKLRKHSDCFWRESYAKAVSKLVRYETQRKIRKIQIGDIIFNSSKDVAKEFGISTQTVYNRVKSKSKKWSSWKYLE